MDDVFLFDNAISNIIKGLKSPSINFTLKTTSKFLLFQTHIFFQMISKKLQKNEVIATFSFMNLFCKCSIFAYLNVQQVPSLLLFNCPIQHLRFNLIYVSSSIYKKTIFKTKIKF